MNHALTSRSHPVTAASDAGTGAHGGIDRRRLLLGGLAALAATGAVGATSTLRAPKAHAAGVGNVLHAGQQLNAGERITSPSGGFFFIQQGDGNAVLYTAAGVPLWSSGTNGRGGAFFANQTDGNLVLYTSTGPAWASGTNGRGAGDLVIQDDGNLVLYTGAGPTWASGTNGGRPAQSPADKVLAFARAQLGDRYQLGANGQDVWDCSSLTQAAYAQVGIAIGRTTWDQVKKGAAVSRSQLRIGDLLFPFSDISHVSLYSGNGNIVEGSSSQGKVVERPIWRFYTARRIL